MEIYYKKANGLNNGYGVFGHTGLVNYAFCDGHVKAMKPSMTVVNNTNMWANDAETDTTNKAPWYNFYPRIVEAVTNSDVDMRTNFE